MYVRDQQPYLQGFSNLVGFSLQLTQLPSSTAAAAAAGLCFLICLLIRVMGFSCVRARNSFVDIFPKSVIGRLLRKSEK